MRHLFLIVALIAATTVMPAAMISHETSIGEAAKAVAAAPKSESTPKAAASLPTKKEITTTEPDENELFEKAVGIIKNFESLHKASAWPYVGYGHRVRPGDGFKRGVALSERQAENLLRKDLKEYVKMYSSYGRDAILLAALAYNCGQGRVNHSEVVRLLKNGSRDIRNAYLSHSRSGGKYRKQLHERRVVEFESLFVP